MCFNKAKISLLWLQEFARIEMTPVQQTAHWVLFAFPLFSSAAVITLYDANPYVERIHQGTFKTCFIHKLFEIEFHLTC